MQGTFLFFVFPLCFALVPVLLLTYFQLAHLTRISSLDRQLTTYHQHTQHDTKPTQY